MLQNPVGGSVRTTLADHADSPALTLCGRPETPGPSGSQTGPETGERGGILVLLGNRLDRPGQGDGRPLTAAQPLVVGGHHRGRDMIGHPAGPGDDGRNTAA